MTVKWYTPTRSAPSNQRNANDGRPRDLFSHLSRFDAGIITASQLWNDLSEHRDALEDVLDDREQDVFDTAELVMAEYTSGHLSGSEARERLRRLLDEQGQLPYLQAQPDIRARAGD